MLQHIRLNKFKFDIYIKLRRLVTRENKIKIDKNRKKDTTLVTTLLNFIYIIFEFVQPSLPKMYVVAYETSSQK